jgi:hypothetical protein
MVAEERAARIIRRLLAPEYSWEQFEQRLLSHKRPEWNQAVAFVADEIREAGRDAKIGHDIDPDLAKEYDAEASVRTESAQLLDLLTVELERRFDALERQIGAMESQCIGTEWEELR